MNTVNSKTQSDSNTILAFIGSMCEPPEVEDNSYMEDLFSQIQNQELE